MSVDKLEQCEQEEETGRSELMAGPPAKRAKRMCRYEAECPAEFTWSLRAAGNEFIAECSLRPQTISFGRGDLVEHATSERHVQALAKVDANFAKKNNKKKKKSNCASAVVCKVCL